MTDKFCPTPWQNILTALAANRCYACGWPLGSCQPFNCAMRYKEDTQHLVEREGWLERQREMSAALTNALSAPLFKDAKLGAVLNEDGSVTPSRAVSSETRAPSQIEADLQKHHERYGEISAAGDKRPLSHEWHNDKRESTPRTDKLRKSVVSERVHPAWVQHAEQLERELLVAQFKLNLAESAADLKAKLKLFEDGEALSSAKREMTEEQVTAAAKESYRKMNNEPLVQRVGGLDRASYCMGFENGCRYVKGEGK